MNTSAFREGKKKLFCAKRAGALFLAAVSALTISACGSSNYDAADYVKLGDYKGVSVVIDGDYSTDDAALDAYIQKQIDQTIPFVQDDTQTKVHNDSYVNVDYVGTDASGTAFDGGSADDVTINVQGNSDAESGTSYITGFSSGLVGAAVGSTVSEQVKFPSDYSSADLAGQTVTFTFTVNYIAKQVTRADLTDEMVSQYFGQSSVSDFEDYERKALIDEKEGEREQDVIAATKEKVVSNAKVTGYPKRAVSERVDDYLARYTANYVPDGQTLSEYLKKNYNETEDDFRDQVEKTVKDNFSEELVFEAIADKEEIYLDTDGFDSYCDQLMDSNNIDSRTDLYETYGQTASAGENYLKHFYICNKALKWCASKARVTEQSGE